MKVASLCKINYQVKYLLLYHLFPPWLFHPQPSVQTCSGQTISHQQCSEGSSHPRRDASAAGTLLIWTPYHCSSYSPAEPGPPLIHHREHPQHQADQHDLHHLHHQGHHGVHVQNSRTGRVRWCLQHELIYFKLSILNGVKYTIVTGSQFFELCVMTLN